MSRLLLMFWTVVMALAPMGAARLADVTPVPAPDPIVEAVAPPAPIAASDSDTTMADRLSGVDLRFGDQRVPFRVMGVFALPGETVPVQVVAADSGYRLEAAAGTIEPLGGGRWSWTAPNASGVTALRVTGPEGTVTLNAFVMVPYGEMKAGVLNGYRIGAYPAPRRGRDAVDQRPSGFVAITDETGDLLVSPHFRLAQFACKAGGLPKYAVVQPRLLLRLEGLLEAARREGIRARTFELMSAYRTPAYNRAIGNVTTFTRHQYGDAADIFVDDLPRDGRMDDLNGDGRFNRADAMVLHELAEATESAAAEGGVVGGLSAYAPNHVHGAFVHVDTRGYAARW